MVNTSGRYATLTERLVNAVLGSRGHTPGDLRRAALDRAAQIGPRRNAAPPGPCLPALLAAYVDKVALHAYRVTEGDIASLERAGSSEDAVFEVTVSAAVGAALARLERGLAALRGEEQA